MGRGGERMKDEGGGCDAEAGRRGGGEGGGGVWGGGFSTTNGHEWARMGRGWCDKVAWCDKVPVP